MKIAELKDTDRTTNRTNEYLCVYPICISKPYNEVRQGLLLLGGVIAAVISISGGHCTVLLQFGGFRT